MSVLLMLFEYLMVGICVALVYRYHITYYSNWTAIFIIGAFSHLGCAIYWTIQVAKGG